MMEHQAAASDSSAFAAHAEIILDLLLQHIAVKLTVVVVDQF